jgi:hypothetical protein
MVDHYWMCFGRTNRLLDLIIPKNRDFFHYFRVRTNISSDSNKIVGKKQNEFHSSKNHDERQRMHHKLQAPFEYPPTETQQRRTITSGIHRIVTSWERLAGPLSELNFPYFKIPSKSSWVLKYSKGFQLGEEYKFL